MCRASARGRPATSPNSSATGDAASATTRRPGRGVGRRRPGRAARPRRRADPERARRRASVVQRPDRHAGLDQREQQRVVERGPASGSRRGRAARARPPRPACGRSSGSRPMWRKKHAVGVRDRLAAQLRPPRRRAAGPTARAAARAGPPGCGRARRGHGQSTGRSSGNSSATARVDPARPRGSPITASRSHRARSSPASVSAPSASSRPTCPPRSANVICGHTDDAVDVEHAAVGVLPDREAPAARGSRRSSRSPRIADGGERDVGMARRDALERVELAAALPALVGKNASTTGPRAASAQTLSTSAPRTSQAGRRRRPRCACAAGSRRLRGLTVASGTANGERVARRRAAGLHALGAQRVDEHEPEEDERGHADEPAVPARAGGARGRRCLRRGAPRRARRAARRRSRAGRSRGDLLAARPGARRQPQAPARAGAASHRSASTSTAGSTTSTPSSDDREVDDRHEAEVAQHPDVRDDEHGEARDRGRAGGEHRGARRAVRARRAPRAGAWPAARSWR